MELLYFFLQARSPGLLCIPHYWIDLPYLNHELGHQIIEAMAVAAFANKQLVVRNDLLLALSFGFHLQPLWSYLQYVIIHVDDLEDSSCNNLPLVWRLPGTSLLTSLSLISSTVNQPRLTSIVLISK
jgi:hypothetical protein